MSGRPSPWRGALLAALLLAGAARAHGPAPAALVPLRAVDGEAAAVLTSIGLATRRDVDEFRYVCPSHWGGEALPFAVALRDGPLVVGAAAGLYRGDADGCAFEALTPPGWDEHLLFGVTAGADAAYVLARRRDGASAAWAVGATGPARPVALPDGLALDSGLVDAAGTLRLAAARPSPALATPSGVTPLAGLDPAPDFLDLRLVDGGAAWIAASRGDERLLVRADLGTGAATVVAVAREHLHGPVLDGTDLLYLADGRLRRRDAGGETDLGPRDWTCLHAIDGVVVACRLRDLWRVSGAAAAPWFALVEIAGADAACGVPACETDWIHYAAEAGLPGRPAETPPGDVAPGGGDGCAGAPGLPWAALAGLWARCRARRRRDGRP